MKNSKVVSSHRLTCITMLSSSTRHFACTCYNLYKSALLPTIYSQFCGCQNNVKLHVTWTIAGLLSNYSVLKQPSTCLCTLNSSAILTYKWQLPPEFSLDWRGGASLTARCHKARVQHTTQHSSEPITRGSTLC